MIFLLRAMFSLSARVPLTNERPRLLYYHKFVGVCHTLLRVFRCSLRVSTNLSCPLVAVGELVIVLVHWIGDALLPQPQP